MLQFIVSGSSSECGNGKKLVSPGEAYWCHLGKALELEMGSGHCLHNIPFVSIF